MSTAEPVVEARPTADPLGQLAVIPDATDLDRMADPAQYVITACERAKTWLAQALEHGDIAQIVELKSQAEAIRIYTMQKQLGKDAQLSAAEIVRRSERGIGMAIRKGQAEGAIAKPGENPFVGNQHGKPGEQNALQSSSKRLPGDIVGADQRVAAYSMTDGVSDEQFDGAIEQAKAEGNLSRANVVRKLKGEAAAAPERPEMLKGTRRHNPERIINETVIALDGLCLGLSLLEPTDFVDLDPEKAEDWSGSLRTSLRTLNQLARGLNRGRA